MRSLIFEITKLVKYQSYPLHKTRMTLIDHLVFIGGLIRSPHMIQHLKALLLAVVNVQLIYTRVIYFFNPSLIHIFKIYYI